MNEKTIRAKIKIIEDILSYNIGSIQRIINTIEPTDRYGDDEIKDELDRQIEKLQASYSKGEVDAHDFNMARSAIVNLLQDAIEISGM